MRTGLVLAAVVFVLITLWQFSRYVAVGADGFTHLVIAVLCLVAAMVCGIAYILTKPKDNMDDISITKI
jgi:hypothetical protein